MGTRHLICIFYNGRFVMAQYCQWDGYADGSGKDLLQFLLDASNIERLKEGLRHIYTPSKEEIERINKEWREMETEWQRRRREEVWDETIDIFDLMSSPMNQRWPSLSRDTGAKILEVITKATVENRVPIRLDLEFATNSLFCEWAYVIDLDDESFEVYAGSEKKDGAASQRFKNIGNDDDTVPRFVGRFAFKELPATKEEFYAALDIDDTED